MQQSFHIEEIRTFPKYTLAAISGLMHHFHDFPGHFLVNFQEFLPKNVEGISNFKEMEQQSSFQIPINLRFLKFINFQDFPGHFARFQDIPGQFLSFPGHSRTFQKVGTPIDDN